MTLQLYIPLEARFLMNGLSVAMARIVQYAKGILFVRLSCTRGELFLMRTSIDKLSAALVLNPGNSAATYVLDTTSALQTIVKICRKRL